MPDYGPTRDDLGRPLGRLAPEIEIADRPDPDRPDRSRTPPTVRGARRHDAVLAIYGARSPQHTAAERFRDDCAMALGARVDGARAAFRVQSGTRYPEPAQAVLDALQRAQEAWSAIGLGGRRITAACILGGMSCRTYDATFRHAHDYRGADNRLVDAYAALPKMSLEKAAQILGTSSRRLDNALTRTGYRRAAQEPQPADKPVRASLFPLPAGSELSWSLLWQGLSGGVPPYPG